MSCANSSSVGLRLRLVSGVVSFCRAFPGSGDAMNIGFSGSVVFPVLVAPYTAQQAMSLRPIQNRFDKLDDLAFRACCNCHSREWQDFRAVSTNAVTRHEIKM